MGERDVRGEMDFNRAEELERIQEDPSSCERRGGLGGKQDEQRKRRDSAVSTVLLLLLLT